MSSAVILSGNNQAEVIGGDNSLSDGGAFNVKIGWFFLASNFPIAVYEEVVAGDD